MSKNKKVDAYSIYDISKWQIELQENSDQSIADNQSHIALPTLQRGFVWKPHQMEALWDSILRGYPIGSLLMSKAENGTKYLLDGQQRCTTIALGFQNPLTDSKTNLLNIKKESLPSIWIDMKPLTKNRYGLRFAIRVLTRSHPWGYRRMDHQKRLSTIDQRNALDHFRKRRGNEKLGFSELSPWERTPWDAHFPIPLFFVLNMNKNELKAKTKELLPDIETKYGACTYEDIEDAWLDQVYQGVNYARRLLLPEILVTKESLEEESNSKTESQEQDATLFLRLNSSGTRISGQELIYSLLKASFPKAKNLVEEIGLNYLAPSTVVNLFIRFLKMRRNGFKSFERPASLEDFRKLLKEDGFKDELEDLIESRKAKKLMDQAIGIIKNHPNNLPAILRKELISRNTDLLLILLAYTFQNKEIDEADKKGIRRSFLQSTLFSGSKEKRKFIPFLFRLLKEGEGEPWQNWPEHWDRLCLENHTLLPPLQNPKEVSKVLRYVREKYLANRANWFLSKEWLKNIFREQEDYIKPLIINPISDNRIDEEVRKEKELEQAVEYWVRLWRYLFWNRQLLVIAQRGYFNREFEEYMAFDGIEDTNKPWDWDHIYPKSWVYRKRGVALLVRDLINSNGNYRALSFNENRSQSNNQSPSRRFENNKKAQVDSFILTNDLPFWLNLTNQDTRLKNNHPKVEAFVKAALTRIDNIYRECYSVMYELSDE